MSARKPKPKPRTKPKSLRDELAMASLPLAHFYQNGDGSWQFDYAAQMAYEMADAMLKARQS